MESNNNYPYQRSLGSEVQIISKQNIHTPVKFCRWTIFSPTCSAECACNSRPCWAFHGAYVTPCMAWEVTLRAPAMFAIIGSVLRGQFVMDSSLNNDPIDPGTTSTWQIFAAALQPDHRYLKHWQTFGVNTDWPSIYVIYVSCYRWCHLVDADMITTHWALTQTSLQRTAVEVLTKMAARREVMERWIIRFLEVSWNLWRSYSMCWSQILNRFVMSVWNGVPLKWILDLFLIIFVSSCSS